MTVTRTWRLIAAFILAVPLHGLTQEAPAGKPAPSNLRGGEYPRILPDRRVIFRTRLPEAKTIVVRARGNDSGMGAEPYALKAMGEGLILRRSDRDAVGGTERRPPASPSIETGGPVHVDC